MSQIGHSIEKNNQYIRGKPRNFKKRLHINPLIIMRSSIDVFRQSVKYFEILEWSRKIIF